MLLCVFPYAYGARNMDIQAADDAQLRNFEACVDQLKVFNWNSFLLFAQEKDGLGVELMSVQGSGRRRLLETNNCVAFVLLLSEPFHQILLLVGRYDVQNSMKAMIQTKM